MRRRETSTPSGQGSARQHSPQPLQGAPTAGLAGADGCSQMVVGGLEAERAMVPAILAETHGPWAAAPQTGAATGNAGQQPAGRLGRMGTMPVTRTVELEPSLAVSVLPLKRIWLASRCTDVSVDSPLANSLPSNVIKTW